jgi:hypothetical protein
MWERFNPIIKPKHFPKEGFFWNVIEIKNNLRAKAFAFIGHWPLVTGH